MLYSVDAEHEVTSVPHAEEYQRWVSRMDPDKFRLIRDFFDKQVDEMLPQGSFNSRWVIPSEWQGTPLQAVWDLLRNEEQAAYFCGLILWEVMMRREGEEWRFYKAEGEIGTYYFLRG
jgi:hypothetical protein